MFLNVIWIQVEISSFNLMWFENLGLHGYSSDWKLEDYKTRNVRLTRQQQKIASRNNFKLRFSETSWDLFRVFLSHFDVIWQLPILRKRMSRWSNNSRKMTSHRNFKLRFSSTSSSLDLVSAFSFNLAWFKKFDCHW